MSGFDYGNARIRAMKSRLLARRDFENLAGATSLAGLLGALTKTAYRKPVELALARATGIECINEALRTDLVNTIGKIRSFYQDGEGEMVGLLLRTYDLHNLIAILRGLGNNVASDKILSALLPVGELDLPALAALSSAPGLRAAIDRMASMHLPFALPLLKLRAEQPGAGVPQMELALQRWHFHQAQRRVAQLSGAEWLKAALDLEADLINLRTALRFVHAPAEREPVSEHTGLSRVRDLFVGPGQLSFALLERLSQQENLKQAVDLLSGAAYGPVLRLGLEMYRASGQLSDLERSLNRFRLSWMAALIKRDPLGIGLVLGYAALKVNEVSNLHWIASAIHLGLKYTAIQERLELAV